MCAPSSILPQDVTGWNVSGCPAAATVLTMKVGHVSWTAFFFLMYQHYLHFLGLHLGPSTSYFSSNKYDSKPGTPASNPKKPAEVWASFVRSDCTLTVETSQDRGLDSWWPPVSHRCSEKTWSVPWSCPTPTTSPQKTSTCWQTPGSRSGRKEFRCRRVRTPSRNPQSGGWADFSKLPRETGSRLLSRLLTHLLLISQGDRREVQRNAFQPPEEEHPVFGSGICRTGLCEHQRAGRGYVSIWSGWHGPLLAASAQPGACPHG